MEDKYLEKFVKSQLEKSLPEIQNELQVSHDKLIATLNSCIDNARALDQKLTELYFRVCPKVINVQINIINIGGQR